ncbi:amidase family protein [Rhizobium leguminosarum]|uniref:amidase family protein n=1 Tax=Rhizobium leguminosarum TaxID=384 RepID=UPI001C954675|nr:amidase family protein [Rhizobium leguminosarum]MBY5666177.1 amidase [Rhizobium leguminosarum]MBY5679475.1 amidase [Rhizobium leguminosarum]
MHKEVTSDQTRAADGLAAQGVAQAARAINDGVFAAETYAEALLDRARELSDLKAFITIDEEAVATAAREADKARSAGASSPLLGVPLGVKDSYLTAGLRTTLGVSNLKDFVPSQDAEAVRAIKHAGAIVFGKNNLVEMSFGLTGDNNPYGQVKNPRAPNRVSGGSSSGSAAAVAAGIVPAAFGGDTIGSIRVPASLCGVVGFKPTTGRWPRNGVAPISHILDTTGVFARTVEDCELIDQVVTKDPAPIATELGDLKGVRFAYAPKQYFDLIDPEVEGRFNNVIHRLRDAGAEIVEIDFGEEFSALADTTTWSIFFRETMGAISAFLKENAIPTSFDEIYRDLKPGLKEAWQHHVLPSGSKWLSDDGYSAVLANDRPKLQRLFSDAFAISGAEALLLPTTPCTAPEIGKENQFLIAGQDVTFAALAKNTVPASGAGLPGISLPMGNAGNGLPIGLEIDARFGGDRRLLSLARRVEALGISSS